jgi:hypothetical protein
MMVAQSRNQMTNSIEPPRAYFPQTRNTQPLLVTSFVRVARNAGESVGLLYFVNTFGSAAACYLAALFVMRASAESGSARWAATLNFMIGGSVLLLWRLRVDDREVGCVEEGVDATVAVKTSYGVVSEEDLSFEVEDGQPFIKKRIEDLFSFAPEVFRGSAGRVRLYDLLRLVKSRQ